MRVGRAGRLLGASVGIGQQPVDGAANVDRRTVGNRHVRCHRGTNEARQFRILDIDGLTGFNREPPQYLLLRCRGLHLQAETAFQFHRARAAATLDLDAHIGQAKRGTCFDGEAQHRLLLVLERHRAFRILDLQSVGIDQRHFQLFFTAGKVVQVERDGGGIAHGQEARRGQLGDHWRRDGDFGVLGTKVVRRRHNGHQAQAAVEVGDLERHFSFAIGIKRHRTGEQVNQADLLRQTLRGLGRRVAAEFEFALGARHLLDQATIHVILIGPITQLAEEEAVRVRRGETRDVENARIDC